MIATAYQKEEKLYRTYSGPHHLSTIPVKDSHLFKIAESVFSFYLKFYNFKQVEIFYWICIEKVLSISSRCKNKENKQ